MSKEPSVHHDYHAKKDRFEITIKHYALKKKSEREQLIKHLIHRLEKGKGLAKANAKKSRGKPKEPMKESRLVEVGD